MSAATKRVLPADVYDALELSALAFGGIGRKAYDDYDADGQNAVAPRCVIGHAAWVVNDPSVSSDGEVCLALAEAGIREAENDDAVVVILDRIGACEGRVSFAEWCAELGVERGA